MIYSNPYAGGGNRAVVMAEESSFGVVANGPGQLMRRTSVALQLEGQGIQSNEIRPSMMVKDWWLGQRQVTGTLAGELSAASFTMLFEGMLRQHFSAGLNINALTSTDVFLDTDGSGQTVFSAPNDDFVSMGFRLGDIVRLSGIGAGAFADANLDFIITELFPGGGTMRIYNSAVVYAPGTAPTSIRVPGGKVMMAASGRLPLSYTFEQQYQDVGVAEQFVGCFVASLSIKAPASGFCTFSATLLGSRMTLTAPVYPTPTQLSKTIPLMASSGVLMLDGAAAGIVTGFNLSISTELNADHAIGSDLLSSIYQGRLSLNGSLSVMAANRDVLTPGWLSEQLFSLSLVMTDSNAPGANFINLFLPQVKLTDASEQDGVMSIIRQFDFVALEQTTDPTMDLTSIVVQDSIGPSTLGSASGGWVFGVSAFGTGAF